MREDMHDDTLTKEIPTGDETQINLPAVQPQTTAQDTDDGIFLVWPDKDDSDSVEQEILFGDGDTLDGLELATEDWLNGVESEKEEADTDDVPEEDDDEEGFSLLPKKKKNKKKKRRHTVTVDGEDEDEEDFAFRKAAEDDELANHPSKKARAQKKKNASESVLSSFKYYKKTRSAKDAMISRVILITLVLAFAIGFLFYAFRLQNLYFADLSGYSTKDVYLQSGLREGMFIFNVRAGEIERRLAKDFPYIHNVRVERTLPDTVTLYFDEDGALFYTQLYDEYFVISESMRVLARYDSEEEVPSALRKITLPAVSYAVVGYPLAFFDDTYLDFLEDTLLVFSEAVVYEHIDEMDFSNRYDLQFEYADRLTFSIGNADNLDTKLLFVKSIAENLESDARGNVTLVDNKMASFTAIGKESASK